MSKKIQLIFDVGSPTAYLAYRRMQQLHAKYDIHFDLQPILLGGVFKATGNSSPAMIPAKGRYMMQFDLPRFARLYNVPLNINPHFPINTLNLMRAAIFAKNNGMLEAYLDVVFDAIWVQEINMGNPNQVQDQLDRTGLDGKLFIESCQDQGIKDALIKNTEEAVNRGVFGVPTFYVDDEMFFGQDRLHFIENMLTAS